MNMPCILAGCIVFYVVVLYFALALFKAGARADKNVEKGLENSKNEEK